MNRKEKDRLRALKREIKRSGNKKVRSRAKRELATNPEEAHLTQIDYGGRSSKKMNGMDRDATRKKKDRKVYNEAPESIMSSQEPSDDNENLSPMPDREQTGSESLPELCPPLQGEGSPNDPPS